MTIEQACLPEELGGRLFFFSPSSLFSMILASAVLSLNSLRMFARRPEEEEEEEASETHRSGFPLSSIILTCCHWDEGVGFFEGDQVFSSSQASCSRAGRGGQGKFHHAEKSSSIMLTYC